MTSLRFPATPYSEREHAIHSAIGITRAQKKRTSRAKSARDGNIALEDDVMIRTRYAPQGQAETRPVKRHPFTMIELLLVLVILGTLAAIVVPKFAGRSEQARVTAAQTEISGVELALDAFEVDNGYYPKGKDGLADLYYEPSDATNWRGPYLKKPITNDPWKRPYIYECPGTHNEHGFDLMSVGPDGRVGGDDDIINWVEK
mgnify:CR=1 FL=1|jgi:general secretion pathway protein G